MTEEIELTELVARCRARSDVPFEVVGPTAGRSVSALTQDSKRATPGSVFGAVRGTRYDGHDFIDDAVARGATAVVAEEVRTDAVPTLVAGDSRWLIGVLSSELWNRPSRELDLIGVTGTNGKTSVVTLLEHVASHGGRSARSIGTLTGSLTTEPAPEFQRSLRRAVDDGVEVVAAEVSSHALDQSRVDGSEFRVAVFTNLSQDHLDYHGDLERYFRAKARLFTPALAQMGVVDVSTTAGARLANEAPIPIMSIDTSAVAVVDVASHRCTFRWRGEGVDIPIGGRFNVANALLVAETAAEIGIADSVIIEALSVAPQIPGRFEYVEAGQPFAVIVDYSHTPASLAAAIAAAAEVIAGKVIVVFGAAGDRDPGKRPHMGEAASAADRVFLTSDNPRTEDPETILDEVQRGIENAELHRIADRRSAIREAVASANDGDAVLIAGKGHEDYQIIGTTRIDFDDRVVAREALAELGWETAA